MINPILKDRLNIIKLDDFSKKEKLTICKNYLVKNILNILCSYIYFRKAYTNKICILNFSIFLVSSQVQN